MTSELRPAVETRAKVLDQLLSELQDGNAWDSTISLLADYADLVQDLLKDREAVRAEVARAIEVELSMCAIANVEAPSEWIDGFEFAWKRVKEALRQYKEATNV